MLTDNERIALTGEADLAFHTADAFRLALPEQIRQWADNYLLQRLEKALYIRDVLKYANDNLHMEAVLRALHGRTQYRGLLERIEAIPAFRDRQTSLIDAAVQELLVADNLPLVNRKVLRDEVRQFLAPGSSPNRVLVIPPSAAPGKSHSETLLRHMAQKLDLAYVFIDCLEIRRGLQAAQLIANELNFHDDRLKSQIEDNSRPGRNFETWLSGKLADAPAPRRAWIVFDHVEQPKPTEEVESIALELAKAAAKGKFRSLYVTLIDSSFQMQAGFGGARSPVYRDAVSHLDANDVAGFIQAWAKARGEPISGDDALAAANSALDRLPQPLDRETTRELVQTRLENCLTGLGLLP